MVNIRFGSVVFYIQQSIEAGSYSVLSRKFKLIVMFANAPGGKTVKCEIV